MPYVRGEREHALEVVKQDTHPGSGVSLRELSEKMLRAILDYRADKVALPGKRPKGITSVLVLTTPPEKRKPVLTNLLKGAKTNITIVQGDPSEYEDFLSILEDPLGRQVRVDAYFGIEGVSLTDVAEEIVRIEHPALARLQYRFPHHLHLNLTLSRPRLHFVTTDGQTSYHEEPEHVSSITPWGTLVRNDPSWTRNWDRRMAAISLMPDLCVRLFSRSS